MSTTVQPIMPSATTSSETTPTPTPTAVASTTAATATDSTSSSLASPGLGVGLALAVVLGLNLYFSLYTFHALSYRCQADCTAKAPVGKTMTAFTGTGENNLFLGRKVVRFFAGVSVLMSVIAILIGVVVMGTAAFAKKT